MLSFFTVSFTWLPGWIHNYGANEQEVQAKYPGAEILNKPIADLAHAISIAAAPAEVWPWIAQIGDTKGGFYSFTFIDILFLAGIFIIMPPALFLNSKILKSEKK